MEASWCSIRASRHSRDRRRLERHDARVSVKQAFSPAEARQLAVDAGVEADYREVFGHRFLLLRDKGRS